MTREHDNDNDSFLDSQSEQTKGKVKSGMCRKVQQSVTSKKFTNRFISHEATSIASRIYEMLQSDSSR